MPLAAARATITIAITPIITITMAIAIAIITIITIRRRLAGHENQPASRCSNAQMLRCTDARMRPVLDTGTSPSSSSHRLALLVL